jgi:hypothetical protein
MKRVQNVICTSSTNLKFVGDMFHSQIIKEYKKVWESYNILHRYAPKWGISSSPIFTTRTKRRKWISCYAHKCGFVLSFCSIKVGELFNTSQGDESCKNRVFNTSRGVLPVRAREIHFYVFSSLFLFLQNTPLFNTSQRDSYFIFLFLFL